MFRLIKPKYIMPFHGDYRMLKRQADIGISCGIPKENTFILKNGDSLELENHVIKKGKSMPGSDIYVDGNRIGEIGSAVIKDRKIMALIRKIENKCEYIIKTQLANSKTNFQTLKTNLIEELYPYINGQTGRKPIILPIILDIKKNTNK